MPIAIVESEKTAIIASIYLPEFIWLACGSLTNLTADKCRVLEGRKVILFPDLNCFEKWGEKAKQLQARLSCSITVSDLLERKSTEADKTNGLYSKYFPLFRVVELDRKLPCTELKADNSPCRQWAMRNDPLRRCVAHRHGNARLEELAQRLKLPLRWVREQKENIIERIKLYQ